MLGCIMKAVYIILLVTLHLGIIDSSFSESRIRQKRAWIIDSFTIEEEHPGPFPFKLGKVHVDRDYRVAFKLHGSGVDEDPKNILNIDEGTGVISVFGKVDYEEYQVLKLKFEARNVSNQQVDTRLGVEITILDINDHKPKFQMDVYETSIEESKNQGLFVITVMAVDDDRTGTPNSTVVFRIVSVTPKTPNVEFFIEENGRISFRGCLDYETSKKYTIVVEAKDCGEVVRLSSSSTVIVHVLDKNNHLPVFTGRKGTGKVKERESGQSPFRILTRDDDTKGTTAWRAKYTITGDRGEHFQIQTDSETNDGILTVIKPLDYEEGAERHLSITVENEEPYFSCQVKRKTSTRLWMVTHVAGDPGTGYMTENITIIVEDVNDPPEFTYHVRDAVVEENIEIGHSLDSFTARDPDGYPPTDIVYVKGDDPGGWVNVDPKTGAITTTKILDRESPFVVNGTYVVTLYAVDKGNPPMSGTATLTIHLKDENDNLPQLHVNTISMCLSDATTMTNITAYDLDAAPYSGPFRFELLGDVKGKWSLDSTYGNTVNLIKKGTVYAGPHQLQLKIYDRQERFSLQNLSITVCDCSIGTNCFVRGASSTQFNGSAIGIIFAALLVLLGVLLLAFLLTCEREKFDFPFPHDSGDVLLSSNIEKPGTDCQIPDTLQLLQMDQHQTEVSQGLCAQNSTFHQTNNNQQVEDQKSSYQDFYQNREEQAYQTQSRNVMYKTTNMQQSQSRSDRYQMSTMSGKYSSSRDSAFLMRKEPLTSLLSQRLCTIQTPGGELCDYNPKVYAYEADTETYKELDCISIDEDNFAPDSLLDLGPRFLTLASICSPKRALC